MIPLSIFAVDLMSENLLLLVSIMIIAAVFVAKAGSKLGTPSLLLFLILGMVVGKDGLGVEFTDYESAESIGHFAMTIILFSGGLQTSLKETRPVMKQGIMLSTLGVFLMVLITGGFIWWVARPFIGALGATLLGCLLLAAVMASTDSISGFSVLHGKRMQLRENLGPLLELESGSNDPMAYLLTILLVKVLSGGGEVVTAHPSLTALTVLLLFVVQVAIGFGVGWLVGAGSRWLLSRIHLPGSALYAILIMSIAFFSNGIASLLGGNGLLALYVTAIRIGNMKDLPCRKDVLKFFDGMTWLMQLLMFLMLGLLVDPSDMLKVALPALAIGVFMMFVARPATVFLCLLPFRDLSVKAKAFVSWVGLKGAGPILFAMYPMVVGLEGASVIFNIVFFITLISLLAQGITLSPMARWLGLSYDEDPEVETFGMEIPDEMGMLRDHTVSEDDLLRGSTLRDMSLPHGIRVMMVRRGEHFLVPHGSMTLQEGDHLVIIVGESDDDLLES